MASVRISVEELRKRVSYDPETGAFTWLTGRRKGERAGGFMSNGYRYIGFNRNCKEYEHRLAFLYMLGEMPLEVDHIDRVKSNNAWGNLRSSTRILQQGNQPKYCNNSSGFRGVYQLPNGRWRARLGVKGKKAHIGVFNTPEEASEAFCKLAKEYYGEHFNGQT